MNKIFLDAREMEHPKPLQVSLAHLKSISNNEYLYMLNLKNPIPLLEIAKEKGFVYVVEQDPKEVWHIIISRNQQVSLKKLLDV